MYRYLRLLEDGRVGHDEIVYAVNKAISSGVNSIHKKDIENNLYHPTFIQSPVHSIFNDKSWSYSSDSYFFSKSSDC